MRQSLFHYTAPVSSHLGSILGEGRIRTTESNISMEVAHAGPDVVWLTDVPEVNPDNARWATGSWSKLEARLTIVIPDTEVHHWPDWSRSHGITDDWYRRLAAGGGDPYGWFVVTRPIMSWELVELRLHDQTFDEMDLRGLFRSSAARRALGLRQTKAVTAQID